MKAFGSFLLIFWKRSNLVVTDISSTLSDYEVLKRVSSREDGIDQFVRYIKLAAAQNGISITSEDEIAIETLVQSTLDVFIGKSQKQITLAVNKFSAMNLQK